MPGHWTEQTSWTLLLASASVSSPDDRETTAAVCSHVKRWPSPAAETMILPFVQVLPASHVQPRLMKPPTASLHRESPVLSRAPVTATVMRQLHAVSPVMAGTDVFLYFHGDERMLHPAAATLFRGLLSSVDRSTTKLLEHYIWSASYSCSNVFC